MDWIQAEDGWSTPTFIPTAAWSPATWVAEAPAGVLQREPVPAAAALTFRARGSFRAWPIRYPIFRDNAILSAICFDE